MMVSDYPEHYAGQHDFEFIKQVPTTWDEVRVLDGRPRENITLARRSGKDWYRRLHHQLGRTRREGPAELSRRREVRC